ncbi:MAG TPA: ResB-like family cytochrome C biogenesis protein [Geobacteraceae bacterium]
MYANPFFLSLIGVFGLNLALCTVRRFKALAKPVLILHGGVILTLFGCILTSFGYVATVNVYEGAMVDRVYRWDLERDVPLGVNLAVKKINWEFYPVPVRIGVLKGGEKKGLYTLKTGGSFDVDDYRVQVGPLEYPSERLKLTVFEKDRCIGSYDTSGPNDLPPDFPYAFKLVGYRTPALKRMWVDLAVSRNAEKLAEGISEVNSPFQWGGLYFYNVQVDRDAAGEPYAGIQIVRDPGRPYVFAGFAVMGLGAVLSFKRRFFRKGQWI